MTEHAKHFFDSEDLPPSVVVYDDSTEWQAWKNRGDPVVHIELGKWADLMVIAPLDANTLAKMAQVFFFNFFDDYIWTWTWSQT